MEKRTNALPQFGTGTAPQESKWLLDGFGVMFEVVLLASVTISGASAGTVVTEPATPLGLIDGTLAVIKDLNAALPDGPSVSIDPVLYFLGTIRALRKPPDITILSSASSGTYATLRASFVIPLSMLQSIFGPVSMADLRSKSSARFRWIGPSAAAAYAALVSGGNGSMAINSLSLTFTELDAINVPHNQPQGFEAAWKCDRFSLTSAGYNSYDLDLKPGEWVRAVWFEVVDGTTPSPSSTLVTQGYMKINGAQNHNFYFVPQQVHSQNLYRVPAANWPIGACFLDFDEDGNMIALPTPASSASKIQLYLNCGSNPAAGSYVRVAYEVIRPVRPSN